MSGWNFKRSLLGYFWLSVLQSVTWRACMCVCVHACFSRVNHMERISADNVHSQEPLLWSASFSYCCLRVYPLSTHKCKERRSHLVPVRSFISVLILSGRVRRPFLNFKDCRQQQALKWLCGCLTDIHMKCHNDSQGLVGLFIKTKTCHSSPGKEKMR